MTDSAANGDQAPRDVACEQALLGSILVAPSNLSLAERGGITPRSFWEVRNQVIYAAMSAMPCESIDLVTITAELNARARLEMVGGAMYVSQLLDNGIGRNVPALVTRLRSLETARRAMEAGRKLAETIASDPREAESATASTLSELQELGTASATLNLSSSAAALRDRSELVAPEPLLAGGLVCSGDLVVFAGSPGLGKSRLSLELCVSLARCEPWLGLPTGSRAMRCGYVAAEFTDYRWIERCVRMFAQDAPGSPQAVLDAYRGISFSVDGGSVQAVTGEALRGTLDIVSESGIAALIDWIERDRLDLLVLDPLSRLMGGRDETNEFFGPLVQALDRIRLRTGCAVLLVHHERKSAPGADPAKGDALDAVRGGRKLVDAALTVIRVAKNAGGLRRVEFIKANNAAEPDPIYFHIPEDGGRTIVDAGPIAKLEANRAKVLAWVSAQSGPSTTNEVAKAVNMSARGVRNHLEALSESGQIEKNRSGKDNTWSPLGERGKEGKERSLSASNWYEPQDLTQFPE